MSAKVPVINGYVYPWGMDITSGATFVSATPEQLRVLSNKYAQNIVYTQAGVAVTLTPAQKDVLELAYATHPGRPNYAAAETSLATPLPTWVDPTDPNQILDIANRTADGDIGTAVATIDTYSQIRINQTTASRALSLPVPTGTLNSFLPVTVVNIGTAAFTMHGRRVESGSAVIYTWDGTTWRSDPNEVLYHLRTLPTVVGNYVDIGNLAVGAGATATDIFIVVTDGGFSVAKHYTLAMSWNLLNGAWYVAVPNENTGAYAGNDFELLIRQANGVLDFRIRRSSGTVAGTARVSLKQYGDVSAVFTPLVTTGTDAATYPIFDTRKEIRDPSLFYAVTGYNPRGSTGYVTSNNGAPGGVMPAGSSEYQTFDGNYSSSVNLPTAVGRDGDIASVFCSSSFAFNINTANTNLPAILRISAGQSVHFQASGGLWRWVAWPPYSSKHSRKEQPGTVLNTVMVPVTSSGSGTTSMSFTANPAYTPVSPQSYIIAEVYGSYYVAGTGVDTWRATLTIGGTAVAQQNQSWTNAAGGGTRSGAMLPIAGRYTNGDITAKAVVATLARLSGDDSIQLPAGASVWVKITEIAR